MAKAIGIDCATPLTLDTAKMLAAAGNRFAARYLVPPSYAWKRLTREEAEAITMAGMYIVSVFETSANRPAGGASSGRADGAAAFREAQAIGQPPGSAIYYAVDYDAAPQDYDAIEAYLTAAASQTPRYATGVYGSFAVVEEMAKRRACTHFWQTYAWSRGKRSDHVNLYQNRNNVQVAGIAVDLNESFGNEGWWSLQIEKPKEENVPMSKEDAIAIIGFLQAAWKAATTQADKNEFHRLANEVRKAANIPLE